MGGFSWDIEKQNVVRDMWCNRDCSAGVISKHVGISRSAVMGWLNRQGLLRGNGKTGSIALVHTISDEKISEAKHLKSLGKSHSQIAALISIPIGSVGYVLKGGRHA